MKKTILLLSLSVMLSGMLLTSCTNSSKKVEDAEKNLIEANEALDKANQEYLADIESFKKETELKIEANEKSIAEFNARIATEKKEARADYKKRIDEIEQKNTDMKKSIADYKADGKENWENFKINFNREMSDWAEKFEELTTKKK